MNPAQQPKNLNLIQQLEKEQIAKLSAGKEIPDFEPGDTLLVNVKVVEGERKIEIPLPSDRDMDRMMSFLERAWRRLIEMANRVQRDINGRI